MNKTEILWGNQVHPEPPKPRVVKLIVESHFHSYWQAGGYVVEYPDGRREDWGSDFITVEPGGIYLQECACGSGFGKEAIKRIPKRLLIGVAEYDRIEYIGKHPVLTAEMQAGVDEMRQ